MNIKDINRIGIFIDRGAKNVFLGKKEPDDEVSTTLQRPITAEFIECMIHWLINKSGEGSKPVVIKQNDIPVFEITIKPAGVLAPTEESPIIKPD